MNVMDWFLLAQVTDGNLAQERTASAQGMMQDLGVGTRASSRDHPSAAQLSQLAVKHVKQIKHVMTQKT